MKEYIVEVVEDSECIHIHGIKKELIRCRDCKHHEDEEPGVVYCPNMVGGWVIEEGYCYLAERRGEELKEEKE